MSFSFGPSGVPGAGAAAGSAGAVSAWPLATARTKNPYSGARMGPFSRSAARKEKLPDFVQTVTIVRATSCACAW